MILALTLAVVSIIILLVTVCMMLLNKPNLNWFGLLTILYLYNLLSESAMLITGLMKMRNHFIANIHTLVASILTMIILHFIWTALTNVSVKKGLMWMTGIFMVLVWVVDNFFIHSFYTFNPLSQAVICMTNLLLVVYLLNVLLFMPGPQALRKTYLFIILGILLTCFSNILIDSFFNMYLQFSEEFYDFVGWLVQLLGSVSHFFVLLGVIWISRARKYSLR